MKKAFYTTPVTNVMKVETTGNILESSNRLGTGDRNNVGMQDDIFNGEFLSIPWKKMRLFTSSLRDCYSLGRPVSLDIRTSSSNSHPDLRLPYVQNSFGLFWRTRSLRLHSRSPNESYLRPHRASTH